MAPKQRLQRVGQDRRPAEAAALELAFAEQEVAAQIELVAPGGDRVSWFTRLARSRDRSPFGEVREAFVQQRGDGAVQHPVAEKLQPLVVRRAVGCGG